MPSNPEPNEEQTGNSDLRGDEREAARLAALDYLSAVRPEADRILQELVDDVRGIFGTDLCMLNLVTADAQYFRAWSGELPKDLAQARQDPRERSMCQYVVEAEKPLVVPDFLATEEFKDQYFRVNYGVHFYAGTPLITSDGHAIGTLCLLHTGPNELSEKQMTLLGAFARAVVGRLETLGALRREQAAREEEARIARQNERILRSAGEGIVGLHRGGEIWFANPAAAAMLGYEPGEMVGRNMHYLAHHTRPDGTPYPIEECPNYRALRDGRAHRSDGYVYWRKDGTSFPVEYASSPVIEGGAVRGAVVTFSDVRERKVAEEALKESEERFRTLTDAALEALIISERGRILEVNRAFTEIFGYEQSEIVGNDAVMAVAPESRDLVRKNILSGHDQPYEAVGLRKNGEHFEAEIRGKASAYRGRTVRITAVRDITERKRAEEALRESEARHFAVVNSAFDAIVTMTSDGNIEAFNEEAENVFGYRTEEVVGRPLALLMPERFREKHRAGLNSYLRGGTSRLIGQRRLELVGQRKDGEEFPLELSLAEVRGRGNPLFTAIIRDITERKRAEERLRYQAFHDSLTNLPNRQLFVDRLEQALARTERSKGKVAVLFMDLDNFKVTNDSLGHESGDRLLVEVTERLSACLRDEDTLARLGGDEFVVLLEDVADISEAVQVADRIAEELQRAPFTVGGQEVFVATSIGIALSTSSQDQPEELLREADIAMYRAKNKGKANHAVFNPTMGARAIRRLRDENDLRRAIKQKELRVFYQPKVLLETGKITDLEALVRWEHPERGQVLPAEFIPLAEETGLIIPLGRWVLEEACRQVRHWQKQYPSSHHLVANVNLSARQFQDPALVEDVARTLEETGLDPSCLELEVTESIVMDHAEATVTTLGKLKGLGVQVAIDDFGTGYSSLSYFNRFPIDTLKIDRSFIEGLGEDHNNTALISGIVSLAYALGLEVIAEGVETADQRAHLLEIGCEKAQGYYFSKPLPAEAAGALLAKDSLL